MTLSPAAQVIFAELKKHCTEKMGFLEIDIHGLEMLANVFDQYAKCNEVLLEKGYTQRAQSGFETLRPEVGMQKDAYDKILKASDKYGITPASRKKIFAMKTEEAKKKGFNLESKNADKRNQTPLAKE